MTRRSHGPSSVALLALLALPLSGQAQETPAVDVVSVKPSDAGDERSASFIQPGGRYTATNVTVRMLIRTAYGVHDDQIVGGPAWINTERFDIAARAEGSPSPTAFRERARRMLPAALAHRFRLVLRAERREISIYALVVARRDGRLGPRLRRSDPAECDVATKTGSPDGEAEWARLPPCGSGFSRPAHMGARAMEFSTLVSNLSSWSDRVLVDQTGLAGTFDWDLWWTQEPLAADAAPLPELSLVTALREQLGLRLEPRRGVVDVLVVEEVERPEPD